MEALTLDMILALVVLAGAIVLFVSEIVRIDVAAILVMVLVGVLGLAPPGEVLAGFASNAVIAIIAVMILGAGLDRVGVMQRVAAFLLEVGARTERQVSALVSGTVSAISAVVQNIGAAALFLPVVERMAQQTGIAASRLLMPMGFAAILGGTITLVASSPMILLNDLLETSADQLGIEIEPLGLFAPAPVGIALTVAGLVFFALLGPKLLPKVSPRSDPSEALPDVEETYGLGEELDSYTVGEDSPLAGREVGTIEAERHGVLLVAIRDSDGLTIAPARDYVVEPGAVVGLGGTPQDLEAFVEHKSLEPIEGDPFALLHDETHAGLAEVVVRPGSDAVGTRVRSLRLRQVFGVTLLAVYRRGEALTETLRRRELRAGDVLVVFAPWERLDHLAEDPSFVVLTDFPSRPPRTEKQWWAVASFTLAMGLVIFTEMQLALALMVGAVSMLLSRVLTPDEAYRSVSWQTVFLLAALIPLGTALEHTGTAAFIAEALIGAIQDYPLWLIQLIVAVLTTVFTLTISNVGATVLLVPLVVNVAVGVDADPAQMALIVGIAASNAFLIPTHQVNALLMSPGGYEVRDFLRVGLLMTVIFLIVLIPAVNLFV